MTGHLSKVAILLVRLVFSQPLLATCFVAPGWNTRPSSFSVLHMAKSKGNRGARAGTGFAQTPASGPKPQAKSSAPPAESTSAPLQSVESGGSDAIPTLTPPDARKKSTDSSLPPEERAKQILREQYGLKSLQEQQTDAKKAEKMAEQTRKREEWKKMAEKEDLDIMAVLPAPVLVAIDRFLKAGVTICTTLFVAAGVAITAEAWSAASGSPLPENIDQFIVNVVEPNFTPGLLVLLGFSVSLGVFSALQLGSESSQYREDN